MNARNWGHDDDLDPIVVGPSIGVRKSSSARHNYELTVIAGDVAEVVHSAGGWIFDRARAGWRVTVLIPSESDPRPLQILGVQALPFDDVYRALRESSPAAVAVASEVVKSDERVHRDVQRLLLRGAIEVTFWGEASSPELDSFTGEVQHQLSAAARAFKTQALITTSPAHPVGVGPTENFRSVAMWYPPNGADLAPIL